MGRTREWLFEAYIVECLLVFWFAGSPMGTFQSFEDMEVWQQSRTLIRAIRDICRRESARKDYAFVDQITRSARSIAASIAEGNDALTTREFIQYLGHAKRSSAEVRSHLYDALDEGYISKEEFDHLVVQAKSIAARIASLIRYLQATDMKRRRIVAHPANL